MAKVARHVMSPHLAGNRSQSTLSSSATVATLGSSSTSFAPSLGSGVEKSKSSRRTAKQSTAETWEAKRGFGVGTGRRHARSTSGTSIQSRSVAFPGLDGTDEGTIAPLPAAHSEYTKSRSGSNASGTKVKIKPFLRKTSSAEKGSLDLSRSQVENEGLGIYTGTSNEVRRETPAAGHRTGHTRNSSAVSQSSTTTATSGHLTGTHYIHPMKQTPHTYTPPVGSSYQNSRANSDEEDDEHPTTSSATSYATSNLPQSYATSGQRGAQMPLHLRTRISNSRLHSASQSNMSGSATPSSLRQLDTASPDVTMPTARSSLESALRMRSRSNTGGTAETEQDAVARLRAEFLAKEEAKKQKRAEIEEKKRNKIEEAQRKRARSNTNTNSEKSVPFSTVEYSSTTALPVDEVLDYASAEERPQLASRSRRSGTQSSNGGQKKRRGSKAGRAASSKWNRFWFAFHTMWLKLKRGVGVGARD